MREMGFGTTSACPKLLRVPLHGEANLAPPWDLFTLKQNQAWTMRTQGRKGTSIPGFIPEWPLQQIKLQSWTAFLNTSIFPLLQPAPQNCPVSLYSFRVPLSVVPHVWSTFVRYARPLGMTHYPQPLAETSFNHNHHMQKSQMFFFIFKALRWLR